MPDDPALYVESYLAATRTATEAFAADLDLRAMLCDMAGDITACLRAGGKLLIAGNGGSAADAAHIAGEIVGRLMFDRAPLPAVALTTDPAVLTAIANDYGYEQVFARQVAGLGRAGDVFLGISTSGNSPNVLRALDAARDAGLVTHAFTGRSGGAMGELCDRLLRVPSERTAIIQQLHLIAAHLICALVERAMFPDRAPPV
jgi:D-sedoheptulose 7-phosphate isomerase